ncbi:motility associated factor glycosyltransferase family protein [Shewanella sp.]|uniref:motility associated factor glycosyltransferase family protein n=1 Tax=Shewanella sp. TaxID=50422 RepID=UPI003A977C76
MTDIFQANLAIIQSRWPSAATILQQQDIEQLDAALVTGSNQTISVNGIQLSSRHNRMAETQLFLSTLPEQAKAATVYGFGMGDVPFVALDEGRLTQLRICILNPAIFALVLSYVDHTPWLNHPGISLELQPSQKTLFKPYMVIAPDLELASDDNARLRDLLMYELNMSYANSKHQSDAPEIQQRFADNHLFIQQDLDVSALKSTFDHDTAIVIAAGPSLELQYGKLAEISRHSERPLIIAVDTALRGLLHHEVKPDIVVSIDGAIAEYHLPLQQSSDICLAYLPRLKPAIIRQWQGPRYNALGSSKLYDELAKIYPNKTRLYTNGSVIHPAVALAIELGAVEVTLCGADFCYVNNKSHAYWHDFAKSSDDKDTKTWTNNLQKSVRHTGHWLINGDNEKMPTSLNLRAYLRNLESFIENHSNVKFYQSSRAGAKIHGAPFREL